MSNRTCILEALVFILVLLGGFATDEITFLVGFQLDKTVSLLLLLSYVLLLLL